MYYYKKPIYLALLINVNSFIISNKPKLTNVIDKSIIYKNSISNDYLSYIEDAPPFISVQNKITKTSSDYLSYIEDAPPFISSSVKSISVPMPTPMPMPIPKNTKTSSDYLSYIEDAPPFISSSVKSISVPMPTPMPIPISKNTKTSSDYLSYIENSTRINSRAKNTMQKHDDISYKGSIVSKKPEDYLTSICASIKIPYTNQQYTNQQYTNQQYTSIKLPEYMYAIDYFNKEIENGRYLANDILDCIGEKFIKETLFYFKSLMS